MDFTKLNGIISAIESQHRAPSPSHAELARLTILALEEIKSILFDEMKAHMRAIETISKPEDVSNIQEEPAEVEPKKKRSKKVGKSLI